LFNRLTLQALYLCLIVPVRYVFPGSRNHLCG